ncbi:predicted protein, partial [Nematostella vectensis]
RYMFGLSGVPALIQGIGMYFLPMSPRWLIVKGKDEQLVATILSLSLVDKGGRRRFLLMGVSVMAASIITLGVVSTLQPLKPPKKCYYTQDGLTNQTTGIPYTDQGNVTDAYMNRTTSADSVRPVNPVLRYLALAGLVMFVAGYSFGFGPGNWCDDQLWERSLRARDDIKETVRLAADSACRKLSKITIQICDVNRGKLGEKGISTVLPTLLHTGLTSGAEEVRSIA